MNRMYGPYEYFEALRINNDRKQLEVSEFITLYPRGRKALAYLGRYLYDNYSTVSYAVDLIANYSAPVIPFSLCKDKVAAHLYNEYFEEWMDLCDITGRFDYPTLQRMACKQIDTEGDSGEYLVEIDGEPRVQFIEGGRIGRPRYVNTFLYAYELDGVIFDKVGRPTQYIVSQSDLEFTLLDANQFHLMYDPDRFSLYRGFSPMRRGANDQRDSNETKVFIKKAVKLGAALGAVVEGGSLEQDVWNNKAGQTPQDTEKAYTEMELLGGDVPVLEPGKKMTQWINQRPSGNEMEFLEVLAATFVSGLGMPPAFYSDAKLTGPNNRSVNDKAQATFERRQDVLAKNAKWNWIRVISDGIAKGRLPAQPDAFKVGYQGPREFSIDRARDAESDRQDFLNGLKSRQTIIGKRGVKSHHEVDQIFEEDASILARCKDLAAQTGLPIETIAAKWGFVAKPPAQAAPAGEVADDSGDQGAEPPGKD